MRRVHQAASNVRGSAKRGDGQEFNFALLAFVSAFLNFDVTSWVSIPL